MVASLKSAGSEFRANTYTKKGQGDPSIDANPKSGGFQIVWESDGQDGSGLGVYGQNFNSNGKKVGSEFLISDITNGSQQNPDVAFDENGNGMWVWQTEGIINSAASNANEPAVGYSYYAANYRTSSKTFGYEDGDGDGDSIYYNHERLRDGGWDDDPVGKDAIDPTVISIGGDMFINGWYRKDEDRAEFRYSVDQVSADFDKVISANGDYSRGFAEAEKTDKIYTNFGDVGMLRTVDTRFGEVREMIVVTTLASDLYSKDGVIQFQIFQESSSAGLAFRYGQNLQTDYNDRFVLEQSGLTGDASNPHVAILKKGAFAITWTELNQTGNNENSDVYVQLFRGNLTEKADAIKVHSASGANQSDAEITTLKDGGFLITWTDDGGKDGDGSSIMSQRFDANGVKLGKAVLVNDTSGGDQTDSAVTTLKNGQVVVTWESETGDGNNSGVMAQKLSIQNYGSKIAQELFGTSNNEKFATKGGNDTVFGGAGKDTIKGGAGKDKLYGEKGNDNLQGGTGNDKLNGGAGNDSLLGGGGKDEFVFNDGVDVIKDFKDDVDTVTFDHSLVKGKLTKNKLANIVEEKQDALVFDFGDDKLTIQGISDFGDLRDDISFA